MGLAVCQAIEGGQTEDHNARNEIALKIDARPTVFCVDRRVFPLSHSGNDKVALGVVHRRIIQRRLMSCNRWSRIKEPHAMSSCEITGCLLLIHGRLFRESVTV